MRPGKGRITVAARTVDEERAECTAANRAGLSFVFVHGLTWTAAALLCFVLPVRLAALVFLLQGFVAFPASLLVERLAGFRTLSGRDNSLVNLFVLIAMSQALALPASIIVFSLDPRYLPVAFAAMNAGHFLAYAWLYRTNSYAALAVTVALGPFALLVATGPDVAFQTSGFVVGGALLATAAYVASSLGPRSVWRNVTTAP